MPRIPRVFEGTISSSPPRRRVDTVAAVRLLHPVFRGRPGNADRRRRL